MVWPSRGLMERLNKLRGEEALSDFTLAAEGREWKVHKAVLFLHSDVLYKMATNDQFIECQKGRAELKDVEARHVDAMVYYFYHQEIEQLDIDSWGGASVELEGICFGIELSVLAEMYAVPGLVEYIEEGLGIVRGQKDQSLKFPTICKAWNTQGVPKEIKEAAAKIGVGCPASLSSEEAQDFMEQHPDLAVLMMKIKAREAKEEQERREQMETAWELASLREVD